MFVLGRILATLSALVLGAHFLRSGQTELMIIAIAVAVAVFIRRRWALWVVQVGMALGVIEWTQTLFSLAAMRRAMGMPYGRMAAILALVATVCLAAIVALSSRSARERYGVSRDEAIA